MCVLSLEWLVRKLGSPPRPLVLCHRYSIAAVAAFVCFCLRTGLYLFRKTPEDLFWCGDVVRYVSDGRGRKLTRDEEIIVQTRHTSFI